MPIPVFFVILTIFVFSESQSGTRGAVERKGRPDWQSKQTEQRSPGAAQGLHLQTQTPQGLHNGRRGVMMQLCCNNDVTIQ